MEHKAPPPPDPAVQPPALPTGQQQPDLYQPPAAGSPPAPQASASMGDDAGIRMLLPVGRSGWAIAAGYLGLLSVTGLLAPVALVVSIIAMRDIQRSRDSARPKHGMGRAVFGLVMGIFGTAMFLLLFLPFFMR